MAKKPDFTYSKQDKDDWDKFTNSVKIRDGVADDEDFFLTETEEKKSATKAILQKIETVTPIAVPEKAKTHPTLPPLVIDRQADIDTATFSKLKKGRMPIDSRLDWHGWTRDGAWAQIKTWLPACQRQGKRCLLLITGKGTGTLQAALSEYLNRPELRPYILCCTTASPKHGGTGAFYIYLKK